MMIGSGRRAGQTALAAVCLAVTTGGAMVGCGGNPIDAVEQAPAYGSYGCVDDSPRCIGERQAALKNLLADKSRNWVRQPASAEAYASGVRMFAFKQKKTELACDELAIGQREAGAAQPTLRAAAGRGLSPAQISRGAMFAGEVGKELAKEQGRRCQGRA
jgi:hypothetical protein